MVNAIILGLSLVLIIGIIVIFTIVDKVSDCHTYKVDRRNWRKNNTN